jgi:hypothetical protein
MVQWVVGGGWCGGEILRCGVMLGAQSPNIRKGRYISQSAIQPASEVKTEVVWASSNTAEHRLSSTILTCHPHNSAQLPTIKLVALQ